MQADARGAAPSLRTPEDRERERGRDGAGSTSGDLSESEDGIPVGSGLVCVRVQNWSHRRHLVVARGSVRVAMWLLFGSGAVRGLYQPESMLPIMRPPTIGLGGGLMSPSGNISIRDRHSRLGSEVRPLCISCTLLSFTDCIFFWC